jgi:uncharacterized protein (UPF0276 family)
MPPAPRAGIGLRQPHYAELLQGPALPLPFVEVHSENFFGEGGAALGVLRAARERWPVSLHGVGLSLGSAAGLDLWHLDQLAALVQHIEPLRVSDHACFARGPLRTRHLTRRLTRDLTHDLERGLIAHACDLLPLAYNDASLGIMVEHVNVVQERLRRTIMVENISAYLRFGDDTLAEPEFFHALARRTGCGVLLDVNNLVVNALNGDRDEAAAVAAARDEAAAVAAAPDEAAAVAAACRWIDALDARAVGQIHLAGYDDGGALVIDDHGSRVRAPVWRVFEHALARLGPVPTLIEWDTGVPPLPVLLAEADGASARLAALTQPTEPTR